MFNLKEIRKARNMKGKEVCKAAELSLSTLSMIENGKRRPSVAVAKRIAAALGFDWTLFFDESGDETESNPGAAGR